MLIYGSNQLEKLHYLSALPFHFYLKTLLCARIIVNISKGNVRLVARVVNVQCWFIAQNRILFRDITNRIENRLESGGFSTCSSATEILRRVPCSAESLILYTVTCLRMKWSTRNWVWFKMFKQGRRSRRRAKYIIVRRLSLLFLPLYAQLKAR